MLQRKANGRFASAGRRSALLLEAKPISNEVVGKNITATGSRVVTIHLQMSSVEHGRGNISCIVCRRRTYM
jgi:hypothetical protein